MPSIAKKFLGLPTTAISDALKGFQHMDSGLKPLNEHDNIAGRAFTVNIPAGDNTGILRAIREANPGDVLVIDGKGYTERAVAGDFVLGLAKDAGIQGIVLDGAIRDIQGSRALQFPVFYRAAAIAASLKGFPGELQVPVSVGGVSVKPGDIIVGDANGVIVVPQEKEEIVLEATLEKLRKDEEREQKYRGSREKALQYLNELFAER